MSEQRFFKGDLVSFGIPPRDKIAEVVEVEEMHIVVKSVGGGLWSIDPYDTEAVRLYARKDARGHERITTLTAANERLRGEVERAEATAEVLRECVRACDIYARAAQTAHGISSDWFATEALPAFEKIEAETAKHLEPGYVGRVVTQEYELTALREQLAEAMGIVEAAVGERMAQLSYYEAQKQDGDYGPHHTNWHSATLKLIDVTDAHIAKLSAARAAGGA